MAKIYGVISTKGGVGKTSFSAQFGGILAGMGQRVLLVDADFQQSLLRGLPRRKPHPRRGFNDDSRGEDQHPDGGMVTAKTSLAHSVYCPETLPVVPDVLSPAPPAPIWPESTETTQAAIIEAATALTILKPEAVSDLS